MRFIETRQQVQEQAYHAVVRYLELYQVETKGVYIQNVEFPPELVEVLTNREIANQERATFEEQERAQRVHIQTEKARGTADMQTELAAAQVRVEISLNEAQARRRAQGEGDAAYVELTGRAEATKTEAIGLAEAAATKALGLARAKGYEAQVEALRQAPTGIVAVDNSVSEGHVKIVPEVLVTGGGGSLDGLSATIMRWLTNGEGNEIPGEPPLGVASGSTRPATPIAETATDLPTQYEGSGNEPPTRTSGAT